AVARGVAPIDPAAGLVQAAAEAPAAGAAVAVGSPGGNVLASGTPLAAEGLVPLEDRAALQRHRAAGPDAAARGIRAGLTIDAVERAPAVGAVAPLGGVVLHGRASQDQGALVVRS